MELIRYNETFTETLHPQSVDEALGAFTEDAVNWLNLGIDDRQRIEQIGDGCALHHLLVDDIVNTKHLPKFEDFESYCFLSLKMLSLNKETMEVQEEQLSLIFSKHFVLTFQEVQENDVFDAVRTRIFKNLGRIRRMGCDYLTYRLLDAVVSEYMLILEAFRERMEAVEEDIVRNPNYDVMSEVTFLKKQIGVIRRSTLPLKEELARLKGEPVAFVQKATRTYLRDVYDNLTYLTSSFESFRDMLKDLMELQLAAVNHSTNKIMKALTIVSSIFIPLTFIVGIYGMNFDFMPELKSPFGYPVVMGFMLALSLGMWQYMKRKNWM